MCCAFWQYGCWFVLRFDFPYVKCYLLLVRASGVPVSHVMRADVYMHAVSRVFFFFFQAEDGIRDVAVTGVQTCALPISVTRRPARESRYARPRVTMSISPRSVIMRRSAQLQCRQRQEGQGEGDDPEAHDDLRLRPARELVMVVERRHAEHAAAGQLEARDLDDHRHRLDDVEAADQRQQELRLREHREHPDRGAHEGDRKSTRLNSSHGYISYAVFCLKKKKKKETHTTRSNQY